MDGIVPDFRLAGAGFPTLTGGLSPASWLDFSFNTHAARVVPGPGRGGPAIVSSTDLVALAEHILTAYAPSKLASSGLPQRRIDAPRVASAGEPFCGIRRNLLKGGFVNVVEGQRAPTMVFGDLSIADKEADRLATKLPGARVLTLRIESAREAKVTTTIEKD